MLEFVDAEVTNETWLILTEMLFKRCEVFCEEFVVDVRHQIRQLYVREAAIFGQTADDVGLVAS